MPTRPLGSITLRPAPSLLAVAGLGLVATAARAQSDPLAEPFPAVLELSDLDGEIGFTIHGIASGDGSGTSVAPAGDVNGDGIGDIIIGAHGADPGGRSVAGSSFVVFGRSAPGGVAFPATLELATLDGANGFRVNGDEAGSVSGTSVAAAGDVNGDGVGDLIIGAFRATPDGRTEVGKAYVVFGRDAAAGVVFPAEVELADLDGANGFRLDGIDPGDQCGLSVSAAGDVNGDGVGDLLIGARGGDPGGRSAAGETYVVFGRDGGGFPAALSLAALDGTNGFRLDGNFEIGGSGTSVAAAGDVNGDGVGDIIIGAPSAVPSVAYYVGQSYVVFGRDAALGASFPASIELADLDGATGFAITGITDFDRSGRSVASAGDVNGDGIDDVIIGAPNALRSALARIGESYVVFGRASAFPASIELADLDGSNGFRLVGADSGEQAGFSVASAGDVNGDGVGDLIIGADGGRPHGLPYAGQSYVVFGRVASEAGPFPAILELTSLDGTTGLRLEGLDERDYTGTSVASAGDINADGVGDLLIGAPHANPGGRDNAGASYVVFGRDLTPCRADLDGDDTLTMYDFMAFQNLFDAMHPRADFDGDGDFTIFDFLAFQNAFDAGCD